MKSDRVFFAFAAFLFAAMVLVNYGPVFLGKVPLPGNLVTQFPVWSEFKSREASQPVADIGDLIDYFYPFNAVSAQEIRNGRVPLWNPYLMSGLPFQAEPQTALFYPLHALYYVFSTPTAWSMALILRMFLAAMFMTLLVRSIGATKTGSIISGITFAFGGFVLAWQGAVMGDTVIWLPLVCYSVHRLRTDPSRRSLCLAVFAFAVPVLAGHPETAIHVILTGTAAAILVWVVAYGGRRRFEMQFLMHFVLAGLLALGFSAVQLLPTIEWIGHSGRDLNAVWGSLDRHEALGFFSRDALRAPNSAGIWIPTAMSYVGMFTLLAAALAPLHRSTRHVIWFGALVIIGIAGTFGFEPVRWLLAHIPIIKGLKNDRLILLADFGLAALAGLGISALQERRATGSTVRRALPWVLTGVAFTTVMFFVHQLQLATTFKVEFVRRPSFSRSLLICALIVIVWKLIRMERARLFPIVACALVIFDLGTFAYGYSGFTWRDEMYPPAPVFDFLKRQAESDIFRIAPVGSTFPLNAPVAYRVQAVTGFEAGLPAAFQRFIIDFTEPYPDRVHLLAEKIVSIPDRRFDMLNLKYVVVTIPQREHEIFSQHPDRFLPVFKKDKTVVFENKTVLPRAFLVGAGGVQIVRGEAEQMDAVKAGTFDPLKSVVVDSIPPQLAGASSEADFAGNVEIVDSNINGYRFRIHASTPAVLVVSQNFYRGWTATVNGTVAPVFPADHALTGIAVPAGASEVSFEFQPASFKLGALLSGISVLVFCGVLASGRTRERGKSRA